MTEQLERHLREVFADDATRAPQMTSLATDAVRMVWQRRRRHLAWAITSASVIIVSLAVVISGALFNSQRNGTPISQPTPTPTSVPSSSSTRTGELPGDVTASCASSYSTKTLAMQAFAFDGTVVALGPPRTNRHGSGLLPSVAVTFSVHEWFHGGSVTMVTVDMAPPQTDSEAADPEPSEEHGPSYAFGTRLLVSGQPRWGGAPLADAIAWSCGFTRYYDPTTAATWRTAFA